MNQILLGKIVLLFLRGATPISLRRAALLLRPRPLPILSPTTNPGQAAKRCQRIGQDTLSPYRQPSDRAQKVSQYHSQVHSRCVRILTVHVSTQLSWCHVDLEYECSFQACCWHCLPTWCVSDADCSGFGSYATLFRRVSFSLIPNVLVDSSSVILWFPDLLFH